MLVSVFTPSHNPKWLRDVWECLLAQTHKDWEWVVVPNGDDAGLVIEAVASITKDDARVRVIPYSGESKIGAIKRFACDNCLGDVFVEYDHDDLITPDCLEAVVEAVVANGPLTFVHSDDVTCDFHGNSLKFSEDFGWRHYDWEYEGRQYTVNQSMPINARTICEIMYAPDHVRAWTRSAYKIAGGHSPDMAVSDDHDLVVRTYLKGIDFVHIPRPLYIHRVTPDSTHRQRVEEINRASRGILDNNLYALVTEWCRRKKLVMLDLGGAHNCPPGFKPVDRNLSEAAVKAGGIKIDLIKQRLSEYGTNVGCIRAVDFLEHVPPAMVPTVLSDLYACLAPDGWLLTLTPAVCDDEGRCGRGATQDPDHKAFWSSNSWWYYTDREFSKYLTPGLYTGRFQMVRVANFYPSQWHRTHLIPYVLADLIALKDDDKQYFAGQKKI